MSTVENLLDQLQKQRKLVDFNSFDLSVRELISMVKDDLINIAPAYQRKFRWDNERQSNLIESIFLTIPIPDMFVAVNSNDGTWELIDGVQRISTILSFAGDIEAFSKINTQNTTPLKLTGLKKLSYFNDMMFTDFPVEIQNKFKLTSIRFTVLTDKSDKDVRFDLFERLNRGGISLSDQEIRSCVYRGRFNDFIKKMSMNSDFCNCVHLSDRMETDGTREELVLRFFAYLYDSESFTHSVKDFLNKYMEKAENNFDYAEGERIFEIVFRELNSALSNGITKGRKNTPMNLYEGVSVGAALAYMEKGSINTSGIEDWISNPELIQYTTGATNSRPQMEGRISFCKSRFEA